MAKLTGRTKDAVLTNPVGAAQDVSRAAGRGGDDGRDQLHRRPERSVWRHRDGAIGLGTSGSGDVLAGIIAGLLARGATPETATIWGVCIHARAGAPPSKAHGTVGFLARELLSEIPAIIDAAA